MCVEYMNESYFAYYFLSYIFDEIIYYPRAIIIKQHAEVHQGATESRENTGYFAHLRER